MKKTMFIICLIFAVPVLVYAYLMGRQPVISEPAFASGGIPQLIKFSAPMCSDCQTMAEVLGDVKKQYNGKVDFVEIQVNQNSTSVREQIKKYSVTLVPTVVVLDKNGQQIARIEGVVPKSEIIGYIEQGLK